MEHQQGTRVRALYYELAENYTVTVDGDRAKTYGVAVFKTKPKTEETSLDERSCLYKSSDITFCRGEMLEHIELWNRFQPSLAQLNDLIEDIICGDEDMLSF